MQARSRPCKKIEHGWRFDIPLDPVPQRPVLPFNLAPSREHVTRSHTHDNGSELTTASGRCFREHTPQPRVSMPARADRKRHGILLLSGALANIPAQSKHCRSSNSERILPLATELLVDNNRAYSSLCDAKCHIRFRDRRNVTAKFRPIRQKVAALICQSRPNRWHGSRQFHHDGIRHRCSTGQERAPCSHRQIDVEGRAFCPVRFRSRSCRPSPRRSRARCSCRARFRPCAAGPSCRAGEPAEDLFRAPGGMPAPWSARTGGPCLRSTDAPDDHLVAIGRKLRGVGNHVGQHLHQARLVGVHNKRRPRRHLCAERDLVLLGKPLMRLDRFEHQPRHPARRA
jgi:hypothetical protein